MVSSSSSAIYAVSPLYAELASRSRSSTIAESFLYTFIVCVGTVGNFAVLLVLYKNRRLRNIPAYFVISLAISDIIMLNLCAPFSIGVLIVGDWIFGYIICQIQGFLVLWVACASLGTLALVAINRYFHIVKTSLYRSIFTPTKAKLIVLGGWLAALITPLTYTAAGKDYVFQPGKFFCYFESKFSLLVLPFHIFIGISMVILIACYISVFKAIKVHERTVVNNLRNGNKRQVTLSLEDIKVTKILFATVVGFIICWTPVLVLDIVDNFLGTEWQLPRETYYMYTIFGITSSAINPIVYGVMNPSYRRAYMRLCGLRRLGHVGDFAETNAHEHPMIKTGETHLR
ncbi:PREDICTED: melatonin receptor type 1A-like isoform X1 [Acropora digitifera]|uniref:melatonin receptor type 1A-like isoform X1 n=1 Tax=Acropora digitifera TaxID=70779 RepID=UPI00077A6F6C|nr:PREDICTED: melatonin receptor type 1A-like isoform X1 [Acropora digitifera]XP_029197005.2 melatonin receptor type 1A-like isoform X1 [Acropora millepora]